MFLVVVIHDLGFRIPDYVSMHTVVFRHVSLRFRRRDEAGNFVADCWEEIPLVCVGTMACFCERRKGEQRWACVMLELYFTCICI